MALAQNVLRLDETEYLHLERQAEFRSEFFDGEMFAMAGGTREHSLIGANLVRELGNHLMGTESVGIVVRLAEVYARVQFPVSRLRK